MSDILRLIGGGLLALIACYIGVLIKKRYTQRQIFYKSANAFAKSLASELSTLKTPLPTFVKNYLQGKKGDFESVLERWLETSASLNKGDRDIFKISILKADEQMELQRFFQPLGKSVLSEQLAHITNFQKLFETRADDCEKDSKKLGNMYFKLCVLMGLALLLILA